MHVNNKHKAKAKDLAPGIEISFANSYDHLGHQEG